MKTTFFLLLISTALYCPNPDDVDAYEANPQQFNGPSQLTIDYFALEDAARNRDLYQLNEILQQRFTNPRPDGWTRHKVIEHLRTNSSVYQDFIEWQRARRKRCFRGA